MTQKGFTLIEMITVVVIVSIVAVIGSRFMVLSTEAYTRTQQRAKLINASRQALERMARQLRVALPNSLRLTNGGSCLEFLPIVSGGNYLNPVPDTENGAGASASIATAPDNVNNDTAMNGPAIFVAVGAMATAEVFGAAPVSLANLRTRTTDSLTLAAAKTWRRNSVNRRFFLLANPQAFCVVGEELRFYDQQDITAAGVDLGDDFHLLAANAVMAASPFVLSPSTEDRNARVTIAIGFRANGEQVDFSQQVGLRNVP